MKELFTTRPPAVFREHLRRQNYRRAIEAPTYIAAAITGGLYTENYPLPAKITLGAATIIFIAGGLTMNRIRRKAEKRWKWVYPDDLPV